MSHLRRVVQLGEVRRATLAVGELIVREPPCARIIVVRRAGNVGGTANLAVPRCSANLARSAPWQANTGSQLGRALQLNPLGQVRLGSSRLASAIRIGLGFGPAQVGGSHCRFGEPFPRRPWPDVGLVFRGLLLIAAGAS
jgi:hypothetical protein